MLSVASTASQSRTLSPAPVGSRCLGSRWRDEGTALAKDAVGEVNNHSDSLERKSEAQWHGTRSVRR
jgi:hypothetical protein